MIIKVGIALAVLLILAVAFRWAFLPARYLPGNRARQLRFRLHLRLHPGKGFATVFGLWLRRGRLAALRRSRRIRRSLPLWHRMLVPGEHSVLLGRAHWRHRLRIPLEEHVLVMAPPRTFKTAFLADLILRYQPVNVFQDAQAVGKFTGPWIWFCTRLCQVAVVVVH